jgi:hypothetical protein
MGQQGPHSVRGEGTMTVNLSREEGAAALAEAKTKAKRKNKYGAKKTMVDGIVFDSAKEAKRYSELKVLESAREISHLELQPKFYLFGSSSQVLIKSDRYPNGRRATWRGDFAYFCSKRNKRICEDVKGVRTDLFILKKAIVVACYPGLEIVEI